MARFHAATLALVALVACVGGVVAGETCLPVGESPLVEIGEPCYLCLRFNNNTQVVTTPIVDDFTQISVEDSNTIMPEGTGFYDITDGSFQPSRDNNLHEDVITVHPVVNDKVAGFWKTYKKWAAGDGNVKTMTVITAIVLVDEGKIVDITYDDGCFFCDENDASKCVLDTFIQDPPSILQNDDYRNCALTDSECSGTNCDLNFYVVWSGTDVNGEFMRSAGMRFSRFRSFGVEGLYNSAKKKAESGAVTAASTASKVQSISGKVV